MKMINAPENLKEEEKKQLGLHFECSPELKKAYELCEALTAIFDESQITNYFLIRQTSGFVEGFNHKVKVLKRRCCGIFNLGHLFQRLFLDLEGYGHYVPE